MDYLIALKNKVDSDYHGEKNCKHYFLAEVDYDITNGHETIEQFCDKYKKQIYSCKYCEDYD